VLLDRYKNVFCRNSVVLAEGRRAKQTLVDDYIRHNAGTIETADLNITVNASVETGHVLVAGDGHFLILQAQVSIQV
jgi:hypothetical protein